MRELIAIGRITRPVGVRGEVFVLPLNGDRNRFAREKQIGVGPSADRTSDREITGCRTHGDGAALKLSGIETREAAEAMRDQFVFVEDARSSSPERGSFFVHEVIGCEVFLPSGRNVGVIRDVLTLPGNDVWIVSDGDREYMVPAVKALIRSVDLPARRVEVTELEGLFE